MGAYFIPLPKHPASSIKHQVSFSLITTLKKWHIFDM